MSIFSAPERREPVYQGDERESLESWLDWHRDTLLTKCAGLDAEQLARRAVPPSTLSLLGLVRHLSEVERGWFRRTLDREATAGLIYCTDESPDEDFDGAVPETAEAARDTYLAEVEAARAAAARHGLEEVVTSRHGTPMNLRRIYLHMIEEYARHNGHADLLRECVDGVTGD